MTWQLFTHVAW